MNPITFKKAMLEAYLAGASNMYCGCYEMQGCMNYMPTGVPGSAALPCPGVRDHAGRGGMGGVRIKFIPAEGGTSY